MTDAESDGPEARTSPHGPQARATTGGNTERRQFDERVDDPRGDRSREWELFVRESAAEPLRHAGSVSSPTADVAREQAAQLFGRTAEALWLCPADETRRFAADGVSLSDRADEYETRDGEDATGDAGSAEPESGGDDA